MSSGDLVTLTKKELKAFIFWSIVGVQTSVGGTYDDIIISIIESYADVIKIEIPRNIKFGQRRPEYKGED